MAQAGACQQQGPFKACGTSVKGQEWATACDVGQAEVQAVGEVGRAVLPEQMQGAFDGEFLHQRKFWHAEQGIESGEQGRSIKAVARAQHPLGFHTTVMGTDSRCAAAAVDCSNCSIRAHCAASSLVSQRTNTWVSIEGMRL